MDIHENHGFLLKAHFFIIVWLFVSCTAKDNSIKPRLEPISESIYASGIVKSKNQYQVFSAVNGLIDEVMVKEGDVVKKGDLLIRLNGESSSLNVYNARLAAEYATLDANADRLKELKSVINLAKSKLKNDSLLAIRQRSLWSQNIGTQVELEQRELAYTNSRIDYEVACIRYDDLKRQLAFSSKQSMNNLAISKVMAEGFFIRADTDGKVYKIVKEKGEFVTTLNPVAIIGDAENFYAELAVDEADIVLIQEGQRVLVTMESYRDELFEAIVERIEPFMNEQSRSFTINVTFVKQPAVLYPNLTLEANIIIQSKEEALTIPRNYLVGDTAVQLRSSEIRKVITGLKDYRRVEIVSGITLEDELLLPDN